ncbi:two-component system response regulator KdpE [Methyloradius palustris]|uniref:DNA-binding response regulator n=1 Tax=Methyloradius palustris TaxID=2778876 RepID=A0A8D5JXG6_9PROT|nr:two-component system response regulator KdpE [Methyloradius palustris]BCM26114.1 DNA-binding response regulator [Methyloradius palustris]
MSEPLANIIVIEDEQQIRRFIITSLENADLQVHSAETGQQGLIEVGTRKPDTVVLDLGLPDMDGIEVIQQIRSWSTVPIIVLSARTDEVEKVKALDAGADDYLTKPFGSAELLARIRAQLRRRSLAVEGNSNNGLYSFGEITVDLPKRQVFRASELVHLTPIEFRLLGILIRNSGRVVTQRQLLKEVWGPTYVESSHYLRIYMGHLRQKLEEDAAQPKYLITETGVGYRLAT